MVFFHGKSFPSRGIPMDGILHGIYFPSHENLPPPMKNAMGTPHWISWEARLPTRTSSVLAQQNRRGKAKLGRFGPDCDSPCVLAIELYDTVEGLRRSTGTPFVFRTRFIQPCTRAPRSQLSTSTRQNHPLLRENAERNHVQGDIGTPSSII